MQRRGFLSAVGTTTVASALIPASSARAQVEARPEWTAEGAPTGTEPATPSSLTESERRHVPVITMPERVRVGRPFDLAIQIGVVPHEQSEAHHITWIDVCLDEARVFVADLTPALAYPILRVSLALEGRTTLSVRARCNQHGVWITRRVVTPA